jgi:glycosyltransferase involved in cell wall biosynthesis
MDEVPLVSVIIPMYNSAAHIADCIRSILAQTWKNIEVIVIDDGCTDDSFALAGQFAGDRVAILRQSNKGAGPARNTGLNAAKGKYVQFMDADDLLSDNKIAAQVQVLENYPDYIAVCDTAYFDNGTDPKQAQPIADWYVDGSDDPADFLIKLYGGHLIAEGVGGMVQPNSWLTPRSVIDKAGPWTEIRSPDDDGEFFCRAILAGKGIKYVPGAVNYYRKVYHQNSLSGQRSHQACANILMTTDLKADSLLSHTTDPRAKLAMGRLYWENAFSFYPAHKDLSKEAELKAKNLLPQDHFVPYRSGLKKILERLIGWKGVKYLQSLRK